MAVATISALLTELVSAAADAAGCGGALDTVEAAVPTGNPDHGDYQSNHAFRLGKALRGNPRATADRVVAALPAHPAVARVAVAGPGFVNFYLDPTWLAAHVEALCADPQGGVPQVGAGRVAVVDYSSPNVAKRMHIGHMRSTLIGNAVHRLLQATGWKVVADNHIGDWGTQFGKLIVAWRRALDPEQFAADGIGELERLYVLFAELAAADPSLDDLARAETAKLQAGDADNLALWRQFVQVSMAEFEAVYARLGVRFDCTLGESSYNDALPGVVEQLLAAGIAVHSDGAIIVPFGEDDASGALRDTTLVIRKKDGAYLYGTTDLATLAHRERTWSPGVVIYVTDMRQQLHFKQVFATWTAWRAAQGLPLPGQPGAAALVHLWFGMLVLPEGAMSTRKGNVIRLVDLLDEAVRRAREVVDSKSPDLSDAARAAVAEAVGCGAVRYADLSQNPQTNVTFDWERMLSLDGNTAPFLLYSLARCRGLQRKGGVAQPSVAGIVLGQPAERELALVIARTPEVVAAAADLCRPNLLCDHLYTLATTFNRFYAECPVLSAPSDAERTARLALVEATATTLQRGLEALGLPILDRM